MKSRLWVVGVLALSFTLMLPGCSAPAAPADGARLNQVPLAAQAASGQFHFLVMADRCGGARPGVFESAIGKVNLLAPDFVMNVGDLIEGYTEEEAKLTAQWDDLQTNAFRLDMPMFYTVGNHDITNPVQAKAFGQRFGRPYYAFVHQGALFMVLCTQDPQEQLGRGQLAWAAEVLKKNANARWTFVFLHHPLWTAQPQRRQANGWNEMDALLKGRRATVFAGHTHTYAATRCGGNDYLALSTTGGASELGGVATGQFDHLVWVTMADKGPRIANLMLDGIYGKDVKPAPAATAPAAKSGE